MLLLLEISSYLSEEYPHPAPPLHAEKIWYWKQLTLLVEL